MLRTRNFTAKFNEIHKGYHNMDSEKKGEREIQRASEQVSERD